MIEKNIGVFNDKTNKKHVSWAYVWRKGGKVFIIENSYIKTCEKLFKFSEIAK